MINLVTFISFESNFTSPSESVENIVLLNFYCLFYNLIYRLKLECLCFMVPDFAKYQVQRNRRNWWWIQARGIEFGKRVDLFAFQTRLITLERQKRFYMYRVTVIKQNLEKTATCDVTLFWFSNDTLNFFKLFYFIQKKIKF